MPNICVAKNDDNTCNDHTVVIVFVPGVMGSRLDFKMQKVLPGTVPGAAVRRPNTCLHCVGSDDRVAMAWWLQLSADDEHEILRFDNKADVMERPSLTTLASQPSFKLTEKEISHGWGEIALQFYLGFLRSLVDPKDPNDRTKFAPSDGSQGLHTPVYAVGYDWRQSNAISAARLVTKIKRFLQQENNAQEVIIISHSMGGLVTRSALLQYADLSSKVVGVLHIQQPVTGATVFDPRRFYTGAIGPFDNPLPLGILIMGTDPQKFALTVCGLRGPLELLPTPQYKDHTGNEKWISFFNHDSPPVQVAVGGPLVDFEPYRTIDHPTGLGGHVTPDARRSG